MKRILVLSVSAGAGHVRAAQAIMETLVMQPGTTVEYRDVMDFVPYVFKKVYTDAYMKVVENLPSVWKSMYRLTDKKSLLPTEQAKNIVEKFNTLKLLQYVKDFQPTDIVCTHFLPANVLEKDSIKSKLGYKLHSIVTDFDAHQLWVHNNVDNYFVATNLACLRLQEKGIDAAKIHITGIPVMPLFYTEQNKQDICTTWKLDINKRKILVMAGGGGVGDLAQVARNVATFAPDATVIVLCGKSVANYNKVQMLTTYYNNVKPVAFTTDVHQLMAIADLVITKPGGLTVSEAVVMKKPLLLISPIPGQEECNALYLQNAGVAMLAEDNVHMQNVLDMLLKENAIDRLKHNYSYIPHKNAGAAITEVIYK